MQLVQLMLGSRQRFVFVTRTGTRMMTQSFDKF